MLVYFESLFSRHSGYKNILERNVKINDLVDDVETEMFYEGMRNEVTDSK